MDDIKTNEAVEAVETSDVDEFDAAFDAGWDDEASAEDDFDLAEEEAEADPVAQPEDAEAAEETAKEPEGSDSSEEKKDGEPAADTEQKNQNQVFKIRVNGQDKLVGLSEMTELAQKGADYDRVKGERDSFKQDAPTIQRYKAQEAFLKELAESANTDIDGLMDNTRARIYSAQDENLSHDQALEKARQLRQAGMEQAPKQEPESAKEADPEAESRQMLLKFLAIYPEVEPESIPKEVWDDSYITGDLVGAYSRYVDKQRIKELEEQIKTITQNNKNRERSTGSRRTAGATTPKDAFDSAWDED